MTDAPGSIRCFTPSIPAASAASTSVASKTSKKCSALPAPLEALDDRLENLVVLEPPLGVEERRETRLHVDHPVLRHVFEHLLGDPFQRGRLLHHGARDGEALEILGEVSHHRTLVKPILELGLVYEGLLGDVARA